MSAPEPHCRIGAVTLKMTAEEHRELHEQLDALAYTNVTEYCIGGHVIVKGLRCTICGSTSPSSHCPPEGITEEERRGQRKSAATRAGRQNRTPRKGR